MGQILSNAKDKLKNLSVGAKTAIITSSMALGSAIPVFAVDGDVDPAIKAGFTSAGTQVAAIVALGISATVGVIALSGGAKAGLKWIKGIFAKAS